MIFFDSKRLPVQVLCSLLLLFLFQASLHAQEISGKITNTNQEPIPSAVIYIEQLQTSASANDEGEYQIKLPEGTYSVFIKSLGYKLVSRQIEVPKQGLVLSVEMVPEVYELSEVVVSGNKTDPAISIMRKVIAKAPYHMREVQHYESSVYLKGTIILDKVPLLVAKTLTLSGAPKSLLKTGNVFVEESVRDITFNAPKYYKQKIRSLHTTFPGNNQNPSNPAMVVMSSFYDPNVMDLISPLSPDAFKHYKFSYEGCFHDADRIIDIIKVTPRRKSQELMEGTLCIVEDKWSLYSVEVTNEPFWGKMAIKELFSPVKEGAWLPVSFQINVDAEVMGIRARYKYTSSVQYRNIQLNQSLKAAVEKTPGVAPQTVLPSTPHTTAQPAAVQKRTPPADALAKNELTNAEMRRISKDITEQVIIISPDTISPEMARQLRGIEKDSLANKRDTAYWNEFRPVPLTAEEMKSYEEGPVSVMQKVRKDSLQISRDSTLTKKKNKNALWPATGKSFSWNDKKISLNYPGLFQLDQLIFNTVDGMRYGLTMSLSVKTDSAKNFSFRPWVGYSMSRQKWMWTATSSVPYGTRPKISGTISLSGGDTDFDFNRTAGIPPLVNSVYSLFLRENYMKLYQSRYLSIQNSSRVSKNINWSASIRYERIRELENHSNFSFFRKNVPYTPNIPNNSRYIGLEGQPYRSVTLNTRMVFTPTASLNRFTNRRTSVPTFSLSYETGLQGIFNSSSNYHKMSLGVQQQWQFTRKRRLDYQLGGDYWLTHKNVWFSSFSQIQTSDVFFSTNTFRNTFQLLPFYEYNTNQWLVRAHAHYSTNLLLLKRLPLISNRIWNENLYLNYLNTPSLNHYIETGYSLGQIMAVGEIGVFTSFENFRYRSVGFKISLGL